MDNKPVPRLPLVLQLLVQILWAVLSALMLLVAVIGLASIVLGVISLFMDLSRSLEMQVGGESVRTTTQKLQFIGVGVVMAILGIGFWWLRQHGRVVGALICYAALMGLFFAIAWAAGRGDVISVGRAGH